MKKSEHSEQCEVVSLCRQSAHIIPDLGMLYAVPNSRKTKSERIYFAQEGQESGIPDLFLAVPRKGCHGLYIEMKIKPHGKLSEDQKKWKVKLEARGYGYTVAWSGLEAWRIILDYLGIKGL